MASTSTTGTLGAQDSNDVKPPGGKMHLRYLKTMELKGKSLAVDDLNPITTFSLPAQQQRHSLLLGRCPGEIRYMIYEFCGIGPGKVHLYEQRGKIVGYTCKHEDISQPCLGTSSCHRVDGQINEVLDRTYYLRTRVQREAVLPCRLGCPCQPFGLLALVLTCQTVHMETLARLYHSKTFIIYKGVFSTILNTDVAVQQYTLSSPLTRIRHLQLDLGHAKQGSTLAIQSKHATLRAVLQVPVSLTSLSVVFNTQFDRTTQSPLDNATIRLLSRFRGLDTFQLVIQNARDCYENTENEPVSPEELEFIRAVPYIETIYAKFVKLRDMADTTGLDEEEKRMVRSEARFEKGLKEKVRRMLAG